MMEGDGSMMEDDGSIMVNVKAWWKHDGKCESMVDYLGSKMKDENSMMEDAKAWRKMMEDVGSMVGNVVCRVKDAGIRSTEDQLTATTAVVKRGKTDGRVLPYQLQTITTTQRVTACSKQKI